MPLLLDPLILLKNLKQFNKFLRLVIYFLSTEAEREKLIRGVYYVDTIPKCVRQHLHTKR